MKIQSGNFVHDNNCTVAEMTRQVAVAAAGSNQSAVRAAEVTFYKTVKASALANGLLGELGAFNSVILQLGSTP